MPVARLQFKESSRLASHSCARERRAAIRWRKDDATDWSHEEPTQVHRTVPDTVRPDGRVLAGGARCPGARLFTRRYTRMTPQPVNPHDHDVRPCLAPWVASAFAVILTAVLA